MRLTRALGLLAALAALSALVSLGVVAGAQGPEPAPTPITVVWDERPQSVDQLEASSRSVVEARVVAVSAGPPLTDGLRSDHSAAIPTQRVALEVADVLRGPDPGKAITLFKTGSDEQHLEGDPPYAQGERYVLFIEPYSGEPGTWVLSAPDGRILLDERGEAHLYVRGPVKQDLEGERKEEIEREVADREAER